MINKIHRVQNKNYDDVPYIFRSKMFDEEDDVNYDTNIKTEFQKSLNMTQISKGTNLFKRNRLSDLSLNQVRNIYRYKF